jgi:tetratricopeptide (TPR) repeat protein
MSRYRIFSALLTAGAIFFASPAVADELQEINKLVKQGQNTAALERLNGYLNSHPKDAQARFLKGLILTEQNKPSDAIAVFTALTQDYPELPEPYNNLAVLYASQQQYEKARIALEMAIRTHPSYATAHENLGDIYAKMASLSYDKALQIDKGNTSAQTKLSMIRDSLLLLVPKHRPPKQSRQNRQARQRRWHSPPHPSRLRQLYPRHYPSL